MFSIEIGQLWAFLLEHIILQNFEKTIFIIIFIIDQLDIPPDPQR